MNNEKLILDLYNKRNILPVYSGTLAIEGILKCLNLKPGSRVLITNTVCYSILYAILNANLTPVIAIPKNGLTLTKQEIREIVKKEKIKVFVAVHQYGYEQEIEKIDGLIIIEDISQAWGIKLNNGKVGENSDYIIASLGETKPLSNGIGGLILSNNEFIKNFDTKTRDCRDSNKCMIEFFYPASINYKQIVKRANRRISRQRKVGNYFKEIISKYSFIDGVEEFNSTPSYHRFLIYVKNSEYKNVINILDKCKINYQKEYKKKLDSINIVKYNNIKVIGTANANNCILLRTNNRYMHIRKLVREMRKYYGS